METAGKQCFPAETVKKGCQSFSTRGLHAGRSPLTCMIGVISDAHVAGNDGLDVISAVRGGNSARLA